MAITVHNYVSNASPSGGGTVGLTLNIGIVPDGFLLVAITQRSNTTAPSNVNWNPGGSGTTVPLTFLGSAVNPSDTVQVHLFGRLAPAPTGAVNGSSVSWTAGASPAWQSAHAIVLQGVSQSNPYTGSAVSGGVLGGPISPLGNVVSGPAASGLINLGSVTTPNSNETVVSVIGYAPVATGSLAAYQGAGTGYNSKLSAAAAAASNVRENLFLALTAGTALSVQYSFAIAGSGYAGLAFALNPSTLGAPYYVDPPNTMLTVARAVSATTLTVQDTTNFPTAGTLRMGDMWQGAGLANLLYYTGKTATTLTGVTTPNSNVAYPIGTLVHAVQLYGLFSSSVASIATQAQQNAALNDLWVVSVTQQGPSAIQAPIVPNTHPGPADDFTLIKSQVNGTNCRTDVYWRRIIAGDTAATFTWTWSISDDNHAITSALYRGCITSGSPIDTGAGAPTGVNGGPGTLETATGLTTSNNDETLVAAFINVNNGDSVPGPAAAPTMAERVDAYSNYLMELPRPTAGATGNQSSTNTTSGAWAAVLFALLKVAGAGITSRNALRTTSAFTAGLSRKGTYGRTPVQSRTTAAVASRKSVFLRTLSRTTTSPAWIVGRRMTKILHNVQSRSGLTAVSRGGSRYPRSNAATMPTWTATASRKGNPFRRAALRAGSIATAAARDLTLRRSAAGTFAAVTATVSRRGSTYKRIAAQARNSLAIVSRVIVGGSVTWFRNAAQNRVGAWVVSRRSSTYFRGSIRTGTIAEVVGRLGSRYRRTPTQSRTTSTAASRSWRTTRNAVRTTAAWLGTASRRITFQRNASRTTAAFLATVRRRGNPFRRAAPLTTTVVSLTVSRKGTFRRTLGQNRTTTIVVSGVKVVGGVSFFIFGPEPIFRQYDSTQYYLPTIYFEVTLRSTTAIDTAYARLFDITAGSAVIGSQLQTTAPHNTGRRYRSGAITLVSGHTYRAEQGHGNGYQAVLSTADWIVQVP